jgi:lipoprotein-anchoring transpeptidase ErfK/SrfK
MGQISSHWRVGATLAIGACLALTSCRVSPTSLSGHSRNAGSGDSGTATPSPGAQNQPVSTEISVSLPGERISTVALTDAANKPVTGTVRSDGTAWVPTQPLAYAMTYHATVTAISTKGTRSTLTTSFTTMPRPGGDPIATALNLQGGGVYGVGMPIAMEFSAPIPDGAKAQVERRLSVTSNPSQTGVWHWYGDRQVLYRPKNYWQPGTKLTVKATLGGLPVSGQHLDTNRSAAVTIGRKTMFRTADATKQMQVFQDGKLVKTFPVSLGAADTPSSTGSMVIMTRERSALWVYGPDDQLEVNYAERLTGDGEYIHAAPWSVADQGHHDVSNGCTNLAPDDAAWVYNNSQIGDPVTVSGTAKHLASGNGWTVWDTSWNDYVKGSALQQQGDRSQGKGGSKPAPPPMRITK